uniref:Reverse transcriptase domain-containing protein n=1 Tax=Amphimedon queenslandica TaxID=400682 RepID=A0A1X7VLI8_AMPQE
MDSILQGIPRVCCYIDDILISGETEEHLKNLEAVIRRLQKHGVTVKLSKCKFLCFRKTGDHGNANCLSRLPLSELGAVDASDVVSRFHEVQMSAVPPTHNQLKPSSIVRMKAEARSYFWWPGLDKDVEEEVRSCNACTNTGLEFGRVELETRATEQRSTPTEIEPRDAPKNPSLPTGDKNPSVFERGTEDCRGHHNEDIGEPGNTGDVPLADTGFQEAPSAPVTTTQRYPTRVRHPPDQPWFVQKYLVAYLSFVNFSVLAFYIN